MENHVVQPVLLDNAPKSAQEWLLCKISFKDVADLSAEMNRCGYGRKDIEDEFVLVVNQTLAKRSTSRAL